MYGIFIIIDNNEYNHTVAHLKLTKFITNPFGHLSGTRFP